MCISLFYQSLVDNQSSRLNWKIVFVMTYIVHLHHRCLCRKGKYYIESFAWCLIYVAIYTIQLLHLCKECWSVEVKQTTYRQKHKWIKKATLVKVFFYGMNVRWAKNFHNSMILISENEDLIRTKSNQHKWYKY